LTSLLQPYTFSFVSSFGFVLFFVPTVCLPTQFYQFSRSFSIKLIIVLRVFMFERQVNLWSEMDVSATEASRAIPAYWPERSLHFLPLSTQVSFLQIPKDFFCAVGVLWKNACRRLFLGHLIIFSVQFIRLFKTPNSRQTLASGSLTMKIVSVACFRLFNRP